MACIRRVFACNATRLGGMLEHAALARQAVPAAELCSQWRGFQSSATFMHAAPVGSGPFHAAVRAPLSSQLKCLPSDVSSARRTLFIQTQSTPNPTSLMFMPGKAVMESGTQGFKTAREGMGSPLAKALFRIDGVEQVFFGADFITVTKTDEFGWPVLKPDIFAAITEFYDSGEPVLYDGAVAENLDNVILDDDTETVAMIKELLETRIRPAVQEDGGDVSFKGFDPDTGIVTLKMLGACSGCPSSALTLKSGIENMLCHYVPEVRGVVEAPADKSESAGMQAFEALERHLSN